jgi:hypothetical protein
VDLGDTAYSGTRVVGGIGKLQKRRKKEKMKMLELLRE